MKGHMLICMIHLYVSRIGHRDRKQMSGLQRRGRGNGEWLFLSPVMKCSGIRGWVCLHNLVHVLKTTELYPLVDESHGK